MKTRLLTLLQPTKTLPPPHRHHLFSKQTPPPPVVSSYVRRRRRRRHEKVVVIMGPTGCGKSRLSIDLASRFFGPKSSEIINCDKIQVHRGLDVTTNKIPLGERRRVTHHLLGAYSSRSAEFSASDFRSSGSCIISRLHRQGKIPFLVGGSNSFIYALLAEKYNPTLDPFVERENSFCRELRHNCCFIWVDVELRVLNSYLVRRVDEMLGSGMYEELVGYFDEVGGGSETSSLGLRKAIGVAEFERYFKAFPGSDSEGGDDVARRRVVAYEEAVREVKDNTCRLAKRQLEKITRLRDWAGWDLNRVDATAFVRAAMGGDSPDEVWDREVVGPSAEIVKRFLNGNI